MNIALANAIVDTIACPCAAHAAALQRFGQRAWRRSYHWLITSGLALHLLGSLEADQSEHFVPAGILERLCTLDRASAARTRELRCDFLDLNRRFAGLGKSYANWKGFALEPDFCADVRLRPQMDFDFIVNPSDATLFESALREAGYQRTCHTDIEATYEIMLGRLYSLEEVYQAKPQRKVELHFVADHASSATRAMDLRGALERRHSVMMDRQSIPVLTPEDAFLSHAAHAGRHALEGWVRLGWLHEIDQFTRRHVRDMMLWQNVCRLAEQPNAPTTSAAVGILLATQVWGNKLPDVAAWAEGALPRSAVLWIEAHGKRLAMADFPGTKLNLLLQRELCDSANWRQVERAALFRRRSIPRIAHVPPSATVRQRFRAACVQLRFATRRIFFHCSETARFYFLKWRWNRTSRMDDELACNVPVTPNSKSLNG